MKKILFLFLAVIIIGIIGLSVYHEGLLPVDKNQTYPIVFVINNGESLKNIVNKLSKENLIRNRLSFYIYIRLNQLDKKIQAGVFRLNKAMSTQQIVNNLLKGSIDISITIIEGMRKEQIADMLEERISLDRKYFLNNAKEGYLFPDTYFIPKQASADAILSILRKNFTKKYSQALLKSGKSTNKKIEEVVTLASLIEREANNEKDRNIIANILTKRLVNNWPLQVDATIQYALGYDAYEKTWWKKNLTFDDLKIDSPFNTYKNLGLPPHPICNPGLSSLIAAIKADGNTPYWFYLTGKDGITRYSNTLEEHQILINKHL